MTWEPLGPSAVLTPNYGLVSGRISALAFDPSDPTGNTLYAGATGGGVWVSTNAAASDPSKIVFRPLTDRPGVLSGAADASISIGALSVQPGGTGVLLAGTGDPNDALDSYYGSGVLRSSDNGKTWTLSYRAVDAEAGSGHDFTGEGFAGFAWGTTNPDFVVAAVSQSRESSLVDADLPRSSYAGLYYSDDAGVSWHLAVITDGDGKEVQGPADTFAGVEGNAATAVVWNKRRGVFVAAVRFHGYYESADGMTWTRMASQPGKGLTAALCPTRKGESGSPACPIFRGALAVNPITGDTFAWTVDENNQDQGLWQDICALNGEACSTTDIQWATQLSTAVLDTDTLQGAATLLNGDYNLVLAAVPSVKDTMLLAGANDLWKCSLAADCVWRNTTNSTTCTSAGVGEYQHALAWNEANPEEVFDGNDSGLWRSEDGIAESGSVCSASDASHWQNLNGSLGSLAEVESMSQVGASPYTLMTGLGFNGTAGVKSTTGPTAQWPQILSGEGGPVAIDPADPDKWYANNGAGVSIRVCDSAAPCVPSDFGDLPAISNADAANDGLTMTEPAPFLVDPADSSQLLVATCRLWRGPAIGGWSSANAVTAMLGTGSTGSYCSGNPLVRSLAAASVTGGGEVVYAGAYGTANGGAAMGGHILTASLNAAGEWSGWTDLTFNPVTNDTVPFNAYGLDISSITIDPHDATGQTVYVTVAGVPNRSQNIRLVYRSVDGGARWKDITMELKYAPANSLVVDPVDADTLYLGTDVGVYVTQNAPTCGDLGATCWTLYGAGLPEAPVTTLSAAPTTTNPNVLVAGTYGRGVWQIPLLSAGMQLTSAAADPASIAFDDQAQGTASDPRIVTLTNNGGIALQPSSVSITGDFGETDNCLGATINTGHSCSIHVTFSPTRLGSRTGQLTIKGNIATGNIVVALSGTGLAPPQVTLQPASFDFGEVEIGSTSPAEQITAANGGASPVSISSVTVTGPFAIAANVCGASLAAETDCQMKVSFTPTAAGTATGVLTMVDAAGTQRVQLSGTGSAAFDFTSTISGSSSQTVASGKTASYSVTLKPLGGSGATFTFQCNSLPQYAACLFSPSSLAVDAGSSGSETVQITTSQTSASVQDSGPLSGVAPLFLGCGLIVVPLALRRRRRHSLVALLLCVAAIGGCSGSGGGGGGQPPPPTTHTTAPGTYSIPLVVTSNGVQHTTTLTLVVD